MESVARLLRDEALRLINHQDRDYFARSAFNRYYYATFLITRSFLAEINSEWAKVSHAAIPEILTGSVQSMIRKAKRRAHHLADGRAEALLSRGAVSSRELSNILLVAYSTRVVADYQPDTTVAFLSGHAFELNNVAISAANSWPEQARNQIATIRRAWEAANAI